MINPLALKPQTPVDSRIFLKTTLHVPYQQHKIPMKPSGKLKEIKFPDFSPTLG